MGCIYGIENTVNSMWYIGKCSRNPDERRRAHFGGYGSQEVKDAIDEFGIKNFTFHILIDGVIPELLDDYETEYVKKYNAKHPYGYNLTTGGGGGSHTAETCLKISKARKGKKLSAEHCRKLSESHKGNTIPPEQRRKISESMKGRPAHNKGVPMSEEARLKMSESKKGVKKSLETRRRMSIAQKGRKRKPHSAEHKRNIGESGKHPMYYPTKEFFHSLPADMPLREKRKQVMAFSGRPYPTVLEWVRKWKND